MVELLFGQLNNLDIIMAALTGIVGSIVLAIAYKMSTNGVDNWKPRKLVHISMGTVIGLTALSYSNLSGPAFATGIFLTVLLYAWAHKPDLITELLIAGSRKGESKLNTFASGFMGMAAFALVFIFFLPRPEVLVAAILTVSWGDAAGEVFGRSYGTKIVNMKLNGKTIEGATGVVTFTFLAIMTSMAVYSIDTCPLCFLPQIFLIALLVAIVELVSKGWTDNFLLPFTTAILMWVLLFPTFNPLVHFGLA